VDVLLLFEKDVTVSLMSSSSTNAVAIESWR
jgi:hypothetical protein